MLIFLKQLNPHFYCTLKGVKIKVDSIERKILYDFNAIFNALTSFSTNIDRIGILMMSYKPVQVSNLPNKRMRGFFSDSIPIHVSGKQTSELTKKTCL